jgi:protein-L-isoaspartate(D-aspartate) O-methyltransferase
MCIGFGSLMIQKNARDRLIERLKTRGIQHPGVLEAILHIPRHQFIDDALYTHAYADHALPIGYGQTISQPYVVALMTQHLLTSGRLHSVLEIGTGCGYQTAILAQLIERVYTVERIRPLLDRAQERLQQLSIHNVQFKYSDGCWGWSENAPYDGILVTAAPEEIPNALLDQLAIGGCLIIPVGPQRSHQELLKIVRTRNRFEQHSLGNVNFVPLRDGVS